MAAAATLASLLAGQARTAKPTLGPIASCDAVAQNGEGTRSLLRISGPKDQAHELIEQAAELSSGRPRLNGYSLLRRSITDLCCRFEQFESSHGKLALVIGFSLAVIVLCAAYIRVCVTIPKTSDDAAFVLIARDILNGNLLLRGWTLPPDNRYTTVIPLYVIGGLFIKPLSLLMNVIPPLLYAVLVAMCTMLAWSESDAPDRFVRLLIVLIVIALPSQFLRDLSVVTKISTVILILLTFRLLASNRNLAVTSLPLILADAGDPFALFAGTLPIALVGLRLMIRQDRRGGRYLIFAGVCLLASRLLLAAIHLAGGFDWKPARTQFVALPALPGNIYLFFESALNLFGANFFDRPLFSLVTAAVLVHLIVMVFVIWMICREARSAISGEQGTMMMLLLAAIIVNVASFVFSTYPVNESTAKYLPTVPIVGALVAALAWHKTGIDRRYFLRAAPPVAAAYVLAFGPLMLRPVAQGPRQVIEFLEKSGLTQGYGSYWSSGILTAWSDGRIVVRQVTSGVDGRLVPFNWRSAKPWYETGKARFVIYNTDPQWSGKNLGVDFWTAIKTWGCPGRIVAMDGYSIMIWRSPLHWPKPEAMHGASRRRFRLPGCGPSQNGKPR